ncbi:hypothetical protein EOL96_02960 [Candidatus Saccharibacteria bacterium]|nr:hypothetical protein [Candidatus Saccharibacteria bacterium]
MDIQPQSTQQISDDQELAKVLAGVNGEPQEASSGTAMSQIEAPVAAGPPPAAQVSTDDAAIDEAVAGIPAVAEPIIPDLSTVPPPATPAINQFTSSEGGELDGVKREAISELRPLVDKLALSPEEKFDTYLLLIRSTDDKSLIAPAHEAAKLIGDETRKAQALLDIIKEIDFLNGPQQPVAQ